MGSTSRHNRPYGFPAANNPLTMTPGLGLALLSLHYTTYGLLWSLAPCSSPQGRTEPWQLSIKGERQEHSSCPTDHPLIYASPPCFNGQGRATDRGNGITKPWPSSARRTSHPVASHPAATGIFRLWGLSLTQILLAQVAEPLNESLAFILCVKVMIAPLGGHHQAQKLQQPW